MLYLQLQTSQVKQTTNLAAVDIFLRHLDSLNSQSYVFIHPRHFFEDTRDISLREELHINTQSQAIPGYAQTISMIRILGTLLERKIRTQRRVEKL